MSEHAAPTTAPAIVIDAARPGSATTKPAQPVALNLSIASIAKSAPIQSPAPAQDVVVGGYRLGKTIGEGTYGKVKIAYDVRTNEKVSFNVGVTVWMLRVRVMLC